MEYIAESALLLVIALVANGLSAVAGGGAGLLQLPVLLFMGLSFATALATHKIASVALGLGASLRHMRDGRLDGWLVAWMLVGGCRASFSVPIWCWRYRSRCCAGL